MTEQEWLEERKRGITGSDIAAICGLNTFKSAYQVYAEKRGLVPPVEETFAMRQGKAVEDFLASEYERINGCLLVKPDPLIETHPDIPWAKGSPDRYVLMFGENKGPGIEIKNVGLTMADHWGESGTKDIAPDAFLQSHWYLGITGRPYWDVFASIAGRECRQYRIEPDDELFGNLLEIAEKFRRDHILKGEPPELVGSDAELDVIRRQFPQHADEVVPIDAEGKMWAQLYLSLSRRIKSLETEQKRIKALLQQRIGDKAGLIGEGFSVTWKQTKDVTKTDWKALALSFNPTVDQFTKFVTTESGSRRFSCKTETEEE